MIYFLLVIKICDPDCHWSRIDAFIREDDCQEIGKTYRQDETVQEYKCVMQMVER
jgi:hypothetical protein